MAKSRPRRTKQLRKHEQGGGHVGLTEVREKYSRIYRERVAPRKKDHVVTPADIAANRQIFEEMSALRKLATTVGLGGKLPDEEDK